MVNQLAAAGPAPSSQSEIDALPRLRASATEISREQLSICYHCDLHLKIHNSFLYSVIIGIV